MALMIPPLSTVLHCLVALALVVTHESLTPARVLAQPAAKPTVLFRNVKVFDGKTDRVINIDQPRHQGATQALDDARAGDLDRRLCDAHDLVAFDQHVPPRLSSTGSLPNSGTGISCSRVVNDGFAHACEEL
jgi:hypothetical protein